MVEVHVSFEVLVFQVSDEPFQNRPVMIIQDSDLCFHGHYDHDFGSLLFGNVL